MFLNDTLTKAFDYLLVPFSAFSPGWGLTVVSLISGVVLLLIYGKISNQKAIKNAKRNIYGCLLESLLFRHDLKLALSSQAKMFGHGLVYFLLAVPPILILMVPCVLILAQLNLRYDVRGLNVGEQAVLSLKLDKKSVLYGVSLQVPDGLRATPALRVEESGEVFWRVDALKLGTHEVALNVEPLNTVIKKEVVVGSDAGIKLQTHTYRDWWFNLLYPGSSMLSKLALPISALTLTYPARSYMFLGMHFHWLVAFLILSILSGIVASRFFKVEI